MNLYLKSYKYLYETTFFNTSFFLFTYFNIYMVYHVVYSVFILEFFRRLKKMFYVFLMTVFNVIVFVVSFL
jgi:hypothetical protein